VLAGNVAAVRESRNPGFLGNCGTSKTQARRASCNPGILGNCGTSKPKQVECVVFFVGVRLSDFL